MTVAWALGCKHKRHHAIVAAVLSQVKQYRRDIAELLRTGKQDYARIRVEAVIRESLTLTVT